MEHPWIVFCFQKVRRKAQNDFQKADTWNYVEKAMFWPLEKKPLHHQNSDMEPERNIQPKSTKLVLQSDAKCIFQGLCQFLAVCFILFTLRLRILIL